MDALERMAFIPPPNEILWPHTQDVRAPADVPFLTHCFQPI